MTLIQMPPVAATRKEEKSTQRAPAAGRGRTRQGSGAGDQPRNLLGAPACAPNPGAPSLTGSLRLGISGWRLRSRSPGGWGGECSRAGVPFAFQWQTGAPPGSDNKDTIEARPPSAAERGQDGGPGGARCCLPSPPRARPDSVMGDRGTSEKRQLGPVAATSGPFPSARAEASRKAGTTAPPPRSPTVPATRQGFQKHNYRPSLREKCWPDLKCPCHLSGSLKPC